MLENYLKELWKISHEIETEVKTKVTINFSDLLVGLGLERQSDAPEMDGDIVNINRCFSAIGQLKAPHRLITKELQLSNFLLLTGELKNEALVILLYDLEERFKPWRLLLLPADERQEKFDYAVKLEQNLEKVYKIYHELKFYLVEVQVNENYTKYQSIITGLTHSAGPSIPDRATSTCANGKKSYIGNYNKQHVPDRQGILTIETDTEPHTVQAEYYGHFDNGEFSAGYYNKTSFISDLIKEQSQMIVNKQGSNFGKIYKQLPSKRELYIGEFNQSQQKNGTGFREKCKKDQPLKENYSGTFKEDKFEAGYVEKYVELKEEKTENDLTFFYKGCMQEGKFHGLAQLFLVRNKKLIETHQFIAIWEKGTVVQIFLNTFNTEMEKIVQKIIFILEDFYNRKSQKSIVNQVYCLRFLSDLFLIFEAKRQENMQEFLALQKDFDFIDNIIKKIEKYIINASFEQDSLSLVFFNKLLNCLGDFKENIIYWLYCNKNLSYQKSEFNFYKILYSFIKNKDNKIENYFYILLDRKCIYRDISIDFSHYFKDATKNLVKFTDVNIEFAVYFSQLLDYLNQWIVEFQQQVKGDVTQEAKASTVITETVKLLKPSLLPRFVDQEVMAAFKIVFQLFLKATSGLFSEKEQNKTEILEYLFNFLNANKPWSPSQGREKISAIKEKIIGMTQAVFLSDMANNWLVIFPAQELHFPLQINVAGSSIAAAEALEKNINQTINFCIFYLRIKKYCNDKINNDLASFLKFQIKFLEKHSFWADNRLLETWMTIVELFHLTSTLAPITWLVELTSLMTIQRIDFKAEIVEHYKALLYKINNIINGTSIIIQHDQKKKVIIKLFSLINNKIKKEYSNTNEKIRLDPSAIRQLRNRDAMQNLSKYFIKLDAVLDGCSEAIKVLIADFEQYASQEDFSEELLKPWKSLNIESNESVEKQIFLIKNYYLYRRTPNQLSLDSVMTMLKSDSLNNISADTEIFLKESYEKYETIWMKWMVDYQKKTKPTLISALKRSIQSNIKIINPKFKNNGIEISKDNKQELIDIIATVSFLFCYNLSAESLELTGIDKNILFMKLNCVQVLGILNIFLNRRSDGVFKNILCDIPTGQGKSWALALVASIFSLFGCTVKVLCHSQYLSKRDAALFECGFKDFKNIIDNVNYFTVRAIRSHFPNVDLSKLVKNLLKNESSEEFTAILQLKQLQKTILLVDEVDVLLDEYLTSYQPFWYLSVPDVGIAELQKKIWDHVTIIKGNLALKAAVLRGVIEFAKRPGFQVLHYDTLSLLNDVPFPEQSGLIQELVDSAFGFYNLMQAAKKVETVSDSQHIIEVYPFLREKVSISEDAADSWSCKCWDSRENQWDNNTYHYYYSAYFYISTFSQEDFEKRHRQYAGQDPNYGRWFIYCGATSYIDILKSCQHVFGFTGTLRLLLNSEKKCLQQLKEDFAYFYCPSFYRNPKLSSPTYNIATTERQWSEKILSAVQEEIFKSRSVLVFFEDENRLDFFYQNYAAQTFGITFLVWTPQRIRDEAGREWKRSHHQQKFEKIQGDMPSELYCGKAKYATLLTRDWGRGVDYKPDHTVIASGGMCVIQTYFPVDEKEEIQLQGRASRRMEPGNYKRILCREHLEQLGLNLARLDESRREHWNQLFETRCRAAESEVLKSTKTMLSAAIEELCDPEKDLQKQKIYFLRKNKSIFGL